jgi:hypothetical protein
MKTIRLLSILAVFLFVAETAIAATLVCTPAGSGNASGTNWTNACAFNSTTPVRGNTYYLAEGTYSGKTLSASGTSYITINKCPSSAQLADSCQSIGGWSDSMGDGQTVFGSSGSYGLTISSAGYYVIDGKTGGGPDNWTTNLGIKLNKVQITSGSYITIRHAEITADKNGTTTDCNNARPMYSNNLNNFTMSYCYVHNAADDMWTVVGTTSNITVEYSKWAFSYQNVACHPDLAQMYGGQYSTITWRYNYIYALKVTYLWGIHQGFTVTNYDIYGNIIEFTPPSVFDSSTSDGLVGNLDSAGQFNNLKFYNNTIVGDWSYNVGFGNPNLTPGSNLVAYNNIWVKLSQSGSNGYGGWGGITHSNNSGYNTSTLGETTRTGNPFVNSTNDNFRLTAATDAGMTLPAPYNVDMYGKVRGADGVWDRGAVEFASSSTPLTTAPPGSLR